MDSISELRDMLKGFFNCNNARLNCFSSMLLALFAVRTVNLREVAVAFAGHVLVDSRYKRIKRFFAGFQIDMDMIARWVFKLFLFSHDKKVYLTIDRTNWFWGKTKINILTLAVTYEGIAIPLFWNLLDKAGNATALEHQEILERFVRLFGKEYIAGVLADREFASGSLFRWFNDNEIPFYIRIKEDSCVGIKRKKLFKAVDIFNDLMPKSKKEFSLKISVFGQQVYLAGSRSEKGELMIVATNQHPKNAIAIYLRRWEIEMLFQSLKGRGFRFEETHLIHLERIERLMALLVVGFCWAHKIGEWRALKKPIIVNQHRENRRPQYSYFRYGFELIREAILHSGRTTKKALKNYIRLIFSPNLSVSGAVL